MKHLVFLFLSIVCLETRAQALHDSAVYTIDREIPSYIDLPAHRAGTQQRVQVQKRASDAVDLRGILNLNDETDAVLTDSLDDADGLKHYFYEERYKGVKVEGTRYALHYKNGELVSLNGNFRTISNVSTTPTMSKDEAGKIASRGENNATATVKDGGLVIYVKDQPYLAYKVEVSALSPIISKCVYVDAHSGKIVDSVSMICNVKGTAETLYAQTREINTTLTTQGYTLYDTSHSAAIQTFNANGNNYFDNDNIWTRAEWNNAAKDIAALDVHWGVGKAYEYFLNKYKRNSYDNKGGTITSYVNINEHNAFWSNSNLHFGYSFEGPYPLTSLDIVSHEFTHGVTQYSSNLVYQGESGALSEGFSDIFAACVENWAMPEKRNNCWLMGDDIADTYFQRSMISPNCKYYKGNGWMDANNTSIDNGGVHINSGVLSFWFYLLANGGEGENGGRTYSVKSIGIDKASQLSYTTLTSYLTSNSGYDDALLCSVRAAIALFGDNSFEHRQVLNAWYAVGLNSVSQFELEGPAYVCDGARATYTLRTDSEYSVETSSDVKLISKEGNKIVVEGDATSSSGQIRILHNGKVVSRKDIWIGGPAVAFVSYSNGYFFAHFLGDESAVYSTSWIMNGTYRTTSDTFVYFDGTPKNGRVDVSVTAYNSCGQGRQFTTTIEVPNKRMYQIIKAEDTNDVYITKTDTGELATQSQAASRNMKYRLVNANTGYCHVEGEIPDTGGLVHLGNVSKGIYLFNLITGDNKTESHKMIFR